MAKKNATTTASRPKPSVPRCDLCLQKDGWKGLCLLQCSSCRVWVHKQCYGLEDDSEKIPGWECWACQAVGKNIEGETLKEGKVRTILQEERPVECVLCSVTDGMHAMHPLYRSPGKDARQVILPASRKPHLPQKLAWVHSLCAFGVCNHKGTRSGVYGCNMEGNYENDDESDEQKAAASDEDDSDTSTFVIRNFVMCGLDGNKEDALYVKALTEHRKLICHICGSRDKFAGRNLRVPLQCCAGDDDEFEDFKAHHSSVSEPCTQAMHVGCAMWGIRGKTPPHRRMWFFPGRPEEDVKYNKPVAAIFCNLHATQMGASETKLKKQPDPGGSTILQKTVVSTSTDDHELPSYASPVLRRTSEHASNPRKAIVTQSSQRCLSLEPSASDATEGQPIRRRQSTGPSSSSAVSSSRHSEKHVDGRKRANAIERQVSASKMTSKVPPKKKAAVSGVSKSTVVRPTPSVAQGPRDAAKASGTALDRPIPIKKSGKRQASFSKKTHTASARLSRALDVRDGVDEPTGKPTGPALSGRSAKLPHEPVGVSNELCKPAPVLKKRRRQNSISEEKRNDDETGESMEDGEEGAVGNEKAQSQEGSNRWAYLWEPGAPAFRIELNSSEERRDVEGYVSSLLSYR